MSIQKIAHINTPHDNIPLGKFRFHTFNLPRGSSYMFGDVLRRGLSTILRVPIAATIVALQVALAIVPVEATATESVAPTIYYNHGYFGTTVATMDVSGCREGLAKVAWGVRIYELTFRLGKEGNWGWCRNTYPFEGYDDFAGLTAACPIANPVFKFNAATKMCEREGGLELRVTPDSSMIPTGLCRVVEPGTDFFMLSMTPAYTGRTCPANA